MPAIRGLVAVLGLLNVAPVLAWTAGLGSFRSWFLATSVPSVLALIALGAVAARRADRSLTNVLTCGVWGGLLGTIGYDLFRVPFAAQGQRVFAPIDSYGILLLGADSSSPLTSFAGWGYHAGNGIGFGIAYAAMALGRRWWWGVAFAMVLESATVLTPFATVYDLRGKTDLILIAYAAHVAYGYPLGRLVQDHRTTLAAVGRLGRFGTAWVLAAVVAGLALWHLPLSRSAELRAGVAVAPGPSAAVRDGRLVPEWLRVGVRDCATVRNDDSTPYVLTGAGGSTELPVGRPVRVCFADTGVHRIRTSARPYSGGFVIVDPA